MSASRKPRSSLGRLGRHWGFAAVIFWPAGCYCCPPDPVDETVVIDSLIVLPPNVSVASSEPFELRVQVKDKRGYVLPPDYAAGVEWDGTAGLSVAGADERVAVTASGAAGTNGTVTASLGTGEATLTGTATVTLVNAMNPVADWLAAKSSPKEPPMIALVDGQAGAVTASDSLFGFVRATRLLPFDGGSGNVVVYARERRVTEAALPITATCNYLNLKYAAAPAPVATGCGAPAESPHDDSWPVKVRVFATPDRAGQATLDVEYARRMFADAWSGIELTARIHTAGLLPTSVLVGLTGSSACRSDGLEGDVGKQLTDIMGIPSGDDVALKPNLITVAYVEGITIESSGITPSGLACLFDAARGAIILIDATAHPYSTLAHELGHAFGLRHSDPSEIAVTPAFEPSNLMWAAESDDIPVIRGGLTLGQTYRMSRAYGSFLEQVAPMRNCQTDTVADTPCPRIRRDIRQR